MIHLDGVREAMPNVTSISMEEDDGGYAAGRRGLVGVCVVGMVQQPGVQFGPVSARDHDRVEGDGMFGRRTIASGVLRGAPRHSTDGRMIQKSFLLLKDNINQFRKDTSRQKSKNSSNWDSSAHKVNHTFTYRTPMASATTPVHNVPHFQRKRSSNSVIVDDPPTMESFMSAMVTWLMALWESIAQGQCAPY